MVLSEDLIHVSINFLYSYKPSKDVICVLDLKKCEIFWASDGIVLAG